MVVAVVAIIIIISMRMMMMMMMMIMFIYYELCFTKKNLLVAEYKLNIRNISMCLRDMPQHMWKTLHRELRVPPRETAEDNCTISGVKIWLLTNRSASWQVFAMALYASRLDGALKELKRLNLLPDTGNSLRNSGYLGLAFHSATV